MTARVMNESDVDMLIRLTKLVWLNVSTAASAADKILILTNLQGLALYGKANYSEKIVTSALTKLTYLHFMASNNLTII